MKNSLLLLAIIWLLAACSKEPTVSSQTPNPAPVDTTEIIERGLPEAAEPIPSDSPESISSPQRRAARLLIGAEVLLRDHLDRLQGKNVALVANHTSCLPSGQHLVDALLEKNIQLKHVFVPEHGFRGTADAGEKVASGKDTKTGLDVISLYGKNKKPTAKQLDGLDLVIFDIQDVGTRFYTYISTMSYVMEACAENSLEIWVLDRPNPNGWYVDGPVLESAHSSFIGLHQIPIVHGMTIGEYATMVNEEGWLKNQVKVDLTIIPAVGYTHDMRWEETGLSWVAPSPNLATEYAAYLYAGICWFEPTPVSVGRGTDDAFTMIGAPWYKDPELAQARVTKNPLSPYGIELKAHSFLPVSLAGKSKYPKYENELCQGIKFEGKVEGKELFLTGILLFQRFYGQFQEGNQGKESFFKSNFERWPGSKTFQSQIEKGLSPEEIWQSWQGDISSFKQIREQYLMYD